MKKGFLLYKDSYEAIQNLSREEKGELLEAFFEYNINNKIPKLSEKVLIAFMFFKIQFNRDIEKYENICDRNRINGLKGGRPKHNPNNPSGYSKTQGNPNNPSEPKKAHRDSHSHSQKDSQIKNIEYRENVQLTEKEYNKLLEKYSLPDIELFLDKLSAYKLSSGKTYKSDYGAILTWVVHSVAKEQKKGGHAQDERLKQTIGSVYNKISEREENNGKQ